MMEVQLEEHCMSRNDKGLDKKLCSVLCKEGPKECLHTLLAHSCLYYYLLSLQYTVLHMLFYCTFYFIFYNFFIFILVVT